MLFVLFVLFVFSRFTTAPRRVGSPPTPIDIDVAALLGRYIDLLALRLAEVGLLVTLAKSREPGLPVFLLGHSAGGVVACLYTLEHQAELAGLICESFAFQVPAPDFALAVLKA